MKFSRKSERQSDENALTKRYRFLFRHDFAISGLSGRHRAKKETNLAGIIRFLAADGALYAVFRTRCLVHVLAKSSQKVVSQGQMRGRVWGKRLITTAPPQHSTSVILTKEDIERAILYLLATASPQGASKLCSYIRENRHFWNFCYAFYVGDLPKC